MQKSEFIQRLREPEIVVAIQAAEKKTSGELRVFISDSHVDDAMAAARVQFDRLGMSQTREHNGVLIFLVPATRKFAVIGDSGVHARCGEHFWQDLTASMTVYFQQAQFTEGIVAGINRAGELLAAHFPHRPDDVNELPDRVERG